jgi:hypothetical protein
MITLFFPSRIAKKAGRCKKSSDLFKVLYGFSQNHIRFIINCVKSPIIVGFVVWGVLAR